jgi:hypothetical protein
MAAFPVPGRFWLARWPTESDQHKRCQPAFPQSSPNIRRCRRHGGHDPPAINGGAVATGERL